MAEGYQNNPYGSNKLYKGVNNTGKVIACGYNTGSGNYFDFFLPCDTSGITSVSVVLSTASNAIFIAAGTRTALPQNTTLTAIFINDFGLTLEYNYDSTQTANQMGIFTSDNIKLTCS